MNTSILSITNKHRGIYAAVALCMGLASTLADQCYSAGGATDEDNVVLSIGSYHVSEACVEMNFNRFSENNAWTLNKERVHAWVQGFVRRQIMTAEAINEGYDKRPEVSAAVRQMEEHMLTDSQGPLYKMLLRESPTLCCLDEVYAREATTYQMEILEVPKSSPAHRLISQVVTGKDQHGNAPVTEQLCQSDEVKYVQGPFLWPFVPDETTSEAICNAPIGRWQSADECDATVLFRIASKAQTSQAPRQKVEVMLAKMAAHWALEKVRHKREMDLLVSGSLGFDWDTAEAIVVNLGVRNPEAASELTPKLLALPANRILAQIESNEGRQVVSVSDFTQYYNSLFLRKLPERTIEVYDLVKDLLMFRRDLREARKLGLDRTSDFSAHRGNYRNGLILDLYVKEQIFPKLNLGRVAAEDYYRNHRTDFERPIRVSGRIYTFQSVNAATAFAEGVAKADSKNGLMDLAFKPFLATPESAYPGVPPLCHVIFSPAKPKVVGPLPKGTEWIVWIWERTLESVQVPFADVEQRIIYHLQQPLIAPFEDGLARELAAKLSVSNRIPEDHLLLASVIHNEHT